MSCVVQWWDVLFVKGMHFSSKNARLLNFYFHFNFLKIDPVADTAQWMALVYIISKVYPNLIVEVVWGTFRMSNLPWLVLAVAFLFEDSLSDLLVNFHTMVA